jgi:hypothetical protein
MPFFNSGLDRIPPVVTNKINKEGDINLTSSAKGKRKGRRKKKENQCTLFWKRKRNTNITWEARRWVDGTCW